jgi:hypothetical protein
MPLLRLGYVEGVARDYKRRGRTTLFAAWTCRTAPGLRIASCCGPIYFGCTWYREAIRFIERLYVLSREIGYSKYWEPTRLSSRDDFLVMPMETYEGGEYKCDTNCRWGQLS